MNQDSRKSNAIFWMISGHKKVVTSYANTGLIMGEKREKSKLLPRNRQHNRRTGYSDTVIPCVVRKSLYSTTDCIHISYTKQISKRSKLTPVPKYPHFPYVCVDS